MAMNRTQVSALDRFTKAQSAAVPRIIWCGAGEYGSGKTHFGLTAPGPIVVMSFDKGLEGVVEKFADDKEIRIAEYDWAPTDDTFDQNEAIALRDQFVSDYYYACEHARTVIVDKETDLWNLVRYAEFGGPSERPNNFDALNQRMRKIVNHPKKLTINAGFVDSMKDEWVSAVGANGKEKGKATGNRKLAGFKELEGLVNVMLWHTEAGGVFSTYCSKARGIGSTDVQGKTFEMLTFAQLGELLCPDTEASDWA